MNKYDRGNTVYYKHDDKTEQVVVTEVIGNGQYEIYLHSTNELKIVNEVDLRNE